MQLYHTCISNYVQEKQLLPSAGVVGTAGEKAFLAHSDPSLAISSPPHVILSAIPSSQASGTQWWSPCQRWPAPWVWKHHLLSPVKWVQVSLGLQAENIILLNAQWAPADSWRPLQAGADMGCYRGTDSSILSVVHKASLKATGASQWGSSWHKKERTYGLWLLFLKGNVRRIWANLCLCTAGEDIRRIYIRVRA